MRASCRWCVPRALDRCDRRRDSWGGEQSDDRRPHTTMYGHWRWANPKCNLRANFFWKWRRIVVIKVIHCPATPSLAQISTSMAVEARWQINTAVAVTVTTLKSSNDYLTLTAKRHCYNLIMYLKPQHSMFLASKAKASGPRDQCQGHEILSVIWPGGQGQTLRTTSGTHYVYWAPLKHTVTVQFMLR